MEFLCNLRQFLDLLENRFDLVGEPLELLEDISERFNHPARFRALSSVQLLALAFGTGR